jgi:hypothetical protein
MSGMIVIPASLRSDFIHMAGMTIHIALESTIHIAGIRSSTLTHGKQMMRDGIHTVFPGMFNCGLPHRIRPLLPRGRVLRISFSHSVGVVTSRLAQE